MFDFEHYGWCLGYDALCDEIWGCSAPNFFRSQALLVAFWAAVYYIFAYGVYPLVEGALKKIPSKYEEENNRHWFASHLTATVLCFIAVSFVLPASLNMRGAGAAIQFGLPSAETESEGHTDDVMNIVKGAQTFLSYVINDLFVGTAHGQLKIDMLVHHVIFICFGTAVFYNCFAQYLVGWLLSMEVSTIFLNYFTFFRNRLGNHWTVVVAFALFMLSFFIFRLIAMIYVSVSFISAVFGLQGQTALATGDIDLWQVDFVVVIVIAGAALQIFWAVGISQKAFKRLCPRNSAKGKKAPGDVETEYEPLIKE